MKKEKLVHIIDPFNMKILKEYSSPTEAFKDTEKNAPMSVFVGIEGNERAMTLDEFRASFK